MIRKLCAAVLCVAVIGTSGADPVLPKAPPVRLAVVNSYGEALSVRYFSATVDAIARAVEPRQLLIHEYDPPSFLKAAKTNAFDISIASSGLSSLMLERTNGSALLTLTSFRAKDPNHANGAAVVVRGDRTDLQTKGDLAGKDLAIVGRQAFAGWQVPAGDMIRQGLDPEHYFGSVTEVGMPMTNVLDAVKSGKADGGFVITCLLEELESEGKVKPGDFRVIGERKGDSGFRCRHSTMLYPGWFLSVKPSLGSADARRVLKALLDLPPSGRSGLYWTVASDWKTMRDLFTLMNLEPEPRGIRWALREYWQYVFGAAILLVILILYSSVITGMTRKRTVALMKSEEDRLRAELELKKQSEKIGSLEKVRAVGLISSMLAHELKQPLAVIMNYAQGLEMRLSRGTMKEEALRHSLSEIEKAGEEADAIVDRVRNFVKGKESAHVPLDLTSEVNRTVETFRRHTDSPITVTVPWSPTLIVCGDPVELGIIFMNLLRNAETATSKNDPGHPPRITITMRREGERAVAEVADNGPRLTDEAFSRLSELGKSTRKEGLGLGLGITKELAEGLGGSIKFERRSERGLTVTVTVPLCPEDKVKAYWSEQKTKNA